MGIYLDFLNIFYFSINYDEKYNTNLKISFRNENLGKHKIFFKFLNSLI